MPIPTPDFEAEFVKAIRKNLKEVLDLLDAGDRGLKQKVSTLSSRFAFVEAEVEKKIRKDVMFRAFFAKDPGKQKLHENIAAAFIGRLPLVKKFKQLPNGALQILSGAVMSRKEIRERGATRRAKTIDFEWESCGLHVYASHKYTKQGGGAQDNQYEDLQHFIREANESRIKDALFLAIADGKYYDLKDLDAGTSKIDRLKQLANQRNVFALTISELESFLTAMCRMEKRRE